MLVELVLATSTTDPIIHVWDFRLGTLMTSFKQNTSHRNGLALCPFPGQPGRESLFMSAQADKPLVHVYSWQKEQIYQKFVCPEKLVSLAVSNRSVYCAGGTEGGKIYVWELSTGLLFKVWDAHYRKVNVLRFTADDAALISGSDDAGVNVWLLSSVIDDSIDELPTPCYSWSSHSLPITDIMCGIGNFYTSRILTSSLDNTCKLWDLSTGYLLTTFIFPTTITCLAFDPAERMFFAGGGDNLIYQVNLYHRKEENMYNSQLPATEGIMAVGGGGTIESVGIEISGKRDGNGLVFQGHTAEITTLSLSYDASVLLSGSDDGSVLVWDVTSRQILKTFKYHKGPITNLCTFLKPPNIFNLGASPTTIQPIAPFKKTQQLQRESNKDYTEDDVTVLLNGNRKETDLFEGLGIIATEYHDLQNAKGYIMQLQSGDTATSLQSQVNELQSELMRIHSHYQRVKGLHNDMYQGLVEEFMQNRKE